MIPTNCFNSPPDSKEIPEGWFIIMADAAYKESITGIGFIIRTRNKEYTPQKITARCKGPTHAELLAIIKGLERLKTIKINIKKIIIYTDCLSAYYFLTYQWNPQRTYIVEAIEKIQNLLTEFGVESDCIHVKTKQIKKVDKIADKARKQEEKRKQRQIQDRIDKIEKAIERSEKIEIIKENGNY